MQYLHSDVWSEVSDYLRAEDIGVICSSSRRVCRHILNRTICLSYTGPVTRLLQGFPNLNTLTCLTSEHGVDVSLLPNNLTVLSLPQDNMLTDDDLCNLPASLTSLDLENNNKITDAGIPRLPRALTYLSLE